MAATSITLQSSFSRLHYPPLRFPHHSRASRSTFPPNSLSTAHHFESTHHSLRLRTLIPKSLCSAGLRKVPSSKCLGKKSAVAASYDDAASIETEVKRTRVGAVREELEKQAKESKESWNEAVDNVKDEAAKAEDAAELNDEEPTDKVIGVLRDTTEQLREQAEKARAVLTATAQETAERSKENLTLLAENAPDPIKDIAEMALKAHSPENANKGAKIHDFCLGIPYGSLLAAGGLIWFIISGSTAAIRFGVILGGALLALSISSLKVWKQGNSSMPYIKGQAVITLIILIREVRKFLEDKAFFPTAIAVIASAAMLGFYSYVYVSGGNPPKKRKEAAAA